LQILVHDLCNDIVRSAKLCLDSIKVES
jgi:hypothetical protein